MQRFAQLYWDLDSSTKTNDKLAALCAYFTDAPPADAAWALYFLSGGKIKRAVNTRLLRTCIAELSQLPDWLIDESYDAVGDLAETLAWLLPPVAEARDESLAETVERRIVSLVGLDPIAQAERVKQTWRELPERECLVWNKLVTGEFRVGAARTLVTRSLAELAGVPQATMAHRLSGAWEPSAEAFDRLIHGGDATNKAHPYPFFLAYPLEAAPESLGAANQWQAEWKWDGIRSQVVRREATLAIWSRGEELVTDRFPELLPTLERLPIGTVIDGEIMAWRDNGPLPFAVLQRRIGRLRVTPRIQAEAPVAIIAYDVLEEHSNDVRPLPLVERRTRLERIVAELDSPLVRLSPKVEFAAWDELQSRWHEARKRNVEGLMLKQLDAPYGVGRQRGSWWKWKSQPYAVDAVLIYAQPGHGRRASLLTDYTFGLWDEGNLVPVAKAYSGLTDEEIRQVDAFVRQHTVEKFGPVRVVEPHLVFELHFEGVQRSTRHKSGVAVRFPRMHRWRHDKLPADADTLATLHGMIREEIK